MSDVSTLVKRNVEYAEPRIRILGTRDTETGWASVSWLAGCFDPLCFDSDCFQSGKIRIYLRPVTESNIETAAGFGVVNKYEVTTYASVGHLDRIIYKGVTYEIETEPHIEYYLGRFMYRRFIMTRLS